MNLILCALLTIGALPPATFTSTNSTVTIASDVQEVQEGDDIRPTTNNRRERRGNGGRGAKG